MPSISIAALTRIFPPRCSSRTGSMMSEMMAPSTFPTSSRTASRCSSSSTNRVMSRVLYSRPYSDDPDVADAPPRVPDGRGDLAHVPRLVADHHADLLYFLVDPLLDLHGHILSARIRFCQTPKKKGKMAHMILVCTACSSQNFVSDERRTVRDIPPRCWTCGEILPLPGETDSASRESKNRARKENEPGSGRNA